MSGASGSPWNSLEIAKLVVSGLTPVVILLLGIWISRLARRLEELQWANRTIVEWRIKVYDEVSTLINDLVCYYTFVGNWKEFNPPQVVSLKRDLDKKIHTAAPLFSKKFLSLYFTFVHTCFETYSGWGRDARLRTPIERHREAAGNQWKKEWEDLFSQAGDCEDPSAVRSAYQALMSDFAEELGLGIDQPNVPSGGIPGNIWRSSITRRWSEQRQSPAAKPERQSAEEQP